MKVALVNTYDIRGGAARAANRLHGALRSAGIDSTLIVQHREGNGAGVRVTGAGALGTLAGAADRLRARLALLPYHGSRPRGLEAFDLDRAWRGADLPCALAGADVVNLHWVAELLDHRTLVHLARRAPVVWTLHDMLPFTGGCHYDHGCGRFTQACGACPQLGSTRDGDLSRLIQARKAAVYARLPAGRLHFVSPSRWLAGELAASTACGRFPVHVIPNSVDLSVFAPSDRASLRASLGLPQEKTVLLFVADHPGTQRKGAACLLEALGGAPALHERLFLVSIGSSPLPVPWQGYRHFPHTNDDRKLAGLLAAADALVVPSMQDNLPNTVLESLACATPVVGFEVGGIPDLVRDGETGWLAGAGNVQELRAALARMSADRDGRRAMGERGRLLVSSACSPETQARAYAELFRSLLGATPRAAPAARAVRS